MSSFRSLARNADFTRLWVGEAVSQLGSAVSMFVFPLVAYAVTGSAVLAGLPVAAWTLGITLSLLPAGVLVDRFDRRRLMMLASGGGLLGYLSLALAGALGVLTLPHLVAAAAVTGVAAGLYGPAEMSAVRSVVTREELPTALSQNQARHHIASLLGGPLGGLLYGLSRTLPFVLDAVSFAVSLVCVSRLRTDLSPTNHTHERPLHELGEGLRYLLSRPYFRASAVFGASLNLVVNAVFFVAILRLVEAGVDPAAIGLVDALAGAGGILGALAAPYVVNRMRTGHLVVAVGWSWVPLLVPLLFWSSPWLVGALLFLGLLLNPAGNAAGQSYRVAITPGHLQGRIASSSQFLAMSTMPLAPLLGGWLLEGYGPTTATLGLLVAAALTALVPTLTRAIRSIPRPADWPVQEEQEEREEPEAALTAAR